MDRYLQSSLIKDLKKKAVLLSGPRQCGKTYLSRHLFKTAVEYLNFDILKDRKKIIRQEWSRNADLLIFDEIHKMKKWKGWLKGIIDSDEFDQSILVTGSAKLNTFKKVGDSLAGRYFSFRLYPLDIKELRMLGHQKKTSDQILNRMMMVSGFPEPYLTEEEGFYGRWQQTHLDIILKQDILETESIRNIKQLETLVLMLTERVGSTLSYNSLREDLSTDDKSIKRWVDILENAYVVFRIYPYQHRSIVGGLKKAPKLYFFDYVRVENSSSRLENLVAMSILKEVHFRKDVLGQDYDLNYLKNKNDREIDFLITKNGKPHAMVEVKTTDDGPSENFKLYSNYFPEVQKIQLVKDLAKETLTKNRVLITPLASWLEKMNF